MTRNLILSGGIYHPFAETSASVAGHLLTCGIESQLESVADGLERLRHETFDLVTINALAFSMTQAEKYAPLRDRYAFVPSDEDKAALTAHVAAGRGLLGLHTAAICFDTWPEWGRILGAQWVWGQSHHPMPDYLEVTGDDGFTVWDELYCGMRLEPDAEVLASACLASGGDAQPVLTVRDRTVYLALGHDLTATTHPGYQRLLLLAAGRALGQARKAA